MSLEYPKTVGMVEDQDDWLMVAKAIFESKGIEFVSLRPTADLIHNKNLGNLDLLLIDVRLQQSFNGFDIAVKAVETDPNTVKIMLSSEYTDRFKLDCVQLKPLVFDNIIESYNKLKNNLSLNHTCIMTRAIEYSKGNR